MDNQEYEKHQTRSTSPTWAISALCRDLTEADPTAIRAVATRLNVLDDQMQRQLGTIAQRKLVLDILALLWSEIYTREATSGN